MGARIWGKLCSCFLGKWRAVAWVGLVLKTEAFKKKTSKHLPSREIVPLYYPLDSYGIFKVTHLDLQGHTL